MNAARIRINGSNYVGLFCITNDTVAFVPESIDERALKTVEKTLDVKAVKIALYDSALLSVFAKMNNKYCIVPNIISGNELTALEREIKVKVVKTEQAIGNLLEFNDTGAVVSKTANEKILDLLTKEKIPYVQMNFATVDAVGSALVATNKGFVATNTITEEEARTISKILGVSGGSSTANTGDALIRNSVVANTKGFIAGEATTGFELNRIEEALGGYQ